MHVSGNYYNSSTHSDSTSWAYFLGFSSKAISYSNGLYSGYVFLGLKHGYGTLKYSNGDKYKGYWLFNKKSGWGKLTYQNGDYYEGRWKADKMCGYGVYYKEGKKYAGTWKDNRLHDFNPVEKEVVVIANEQNSSPNTSTKDSLIALVKGETPKSKTINSKSITTNPPVVIGESIVIIATKVPEINAVDTIEGLPPVFSFGTKVIKYDNGDRYDGKVRFGRRNKQGRMTFSNGNVYEGNWVNDKPEGEGLLLTKNNIEYFGLWKGMNGFGKIKFPDGRIYKGDWDTLRRKGPATVSYPDGGLFQGTFKNDIRDGYGTMKYADSTVFSFEGTWEDGKRYGHGTMKFTDGRKFKGEFLNDMRHGAGVIFNSNGDIEVEAEWEFGKRKIQPTKVNYFSGDVYNGFLDNYDGDLKYNKREGYGSMEWANSNIYMSYRSGQRYVGDWHNNMRHGVGTHFYSSRVKYVGKWENDMRHGEGVLYFADGKPLKGIWKNNRFVGKMPFDCRGNTINGYGIKIKYDGSTYEGFWIKGQKNGYGISHEKDGSVYEGNWIRNNPNGRGVKRNEHAVTEGIYRRRSNIIFRRDSTYMSLDWALLEVGKVKSLKLTKEEVMSDKFKLISRLKKLKELSIVINKPLSEFPELFELTNLESLTVKFSISAHEDTLSSAIKKLSKLRVLNLEGHAFSYITPEIGSLKHLKVVNLIGLNNDDAIPLTLPLDFWNLINLKELYLDGNKIDKLPLQFAQLKQLEILSVKENLLRNFPTEISKLTNLKSLNVFHNRLVALPKDIGKLSNLTHLDASMNFISNLPASFCQLSDNYKHIYDLRMNKISPAVNRKITKCFQKANVQF